MYTWQKGMYMIRGVIFDMDGVMIDSERQSNEGWLWAAKQKNVTMPMWLIDSFKGAPASLSCQFFDDYFKGEIDYWETRKLRTEYVYRLREKEGIPVKEGLDTLLDYIRSKHLKCAVATSTRRESAENTLHTIGAWDYLDKVVYGDEVEHGKPEPDIFLKAAADLGLKPEECIVIEDSINGIKAGYAAGIKVVHIPDTIIINDEVRSLTSAVCEQLSCVPQIIECWNLNIDRENVKKTFSDYTKKYVSDCDIDTGADMVKLKIDHTYRVADISEQIARAEGLCQEDIDLSWLLGMFHDIGRFEQIKRYGTFNDAQSTDHASLSADILFKDGEISKYLKASGLNFAYELMELAIRSHNMYRIPDDLTEREKLFCNILRDADKLDILRVCVEEPTEAVYEVSIDELKNSEVSEEVLKAFEQGKTVLKSIRKTAVDKLVGHISLVYELVFKSSLKIAAEQGNLKKLLDFTSDNPTARKQFEYIKEKMNKVL